MFMGPDDLGVDRHMIGDQRIATDTFLQAKIFRGMVGIKRVNLRFDSLSIATRVGLIADIE